MAIKKSALYSSLWKSCDELRGGMDASQYKDYVLTLLFIKYVSDKYAGKSDSFIEIQKGGGFADLAALKGDKEIIVVDKLLTGFNAPPSTYIYAEDTSNKDALKNNKPRRLALYKEGGSFIRAYAGFSQ